MSENNRDQENLFSDEYATPKKENPYLKKNREKARSTPDPEPAPRRVRKSKPAADDGAGYVHKRTFSDWIFEHIKLIASLATILVVLSLVLITDVVSVVEDLVTQSQQADREEITLTYVKGLTEKSVPIAWSDLERYRRDESKAEGTVTWMLTVEGTAYEVWISGVDTAHAPTYVYLYDMKTGDRMILGSDNFDEFMEAHP